MHVSKSDGDNWEKKWQIVNWAEIVILWLRWKTVVALAPLFSKYLLGAAHWPHTNLAEWMYHTGTPLLTWMLKGKWRKTNYGVFNSALVNIWKQHQNDGVLFQLPVFSLNFLLRKHRLNFCECEVFTAKKILSHRKCSETKATQIEPEICEYLTFTSLQDFVSGRCVCVCECERIVSLLCSIM